MTAPAASQISARAGAAEPTSMALPPGEAVGPLSIGRDGTWRVVAPGVLEEHAFLYFNGTELFIQSADPNSPVTVNGATIPGDWTPVYAPCEIAFGGARLWFGPPSQASRSRPPSPPSPPSPPAPPAPPPEPKRAPADSPSTVGRRPFGPRVHGLDNAEEESTRVNSIEELQAALKKIPRDVTGATLKSPGSEPGGAPSVGAPTFGAPQSSGGAPSFGAPPSAAPVMGPGPMFGAPPPSVPMMFPSAAPEAPMGTAPPAKRESWIGARWREASGPKKALMLLLVPLIWAVWVIFTDKPPPARTQKPATSASAAPSSTPSAGAPSATSSASGAPSADPTPVAPTPSGKASASPSAAATTSSREKTREREAADAVAAGAYDKAGRLYEELAKAHPEVPAYVEAARILKAKAGKR